MITLESRGNKGNNLTIILYYRLLASQGGRLAPLQLLLVSVFCKENICVAST